MAPNDKKLSSMIISVILVFLLFSANSTQARKLLGSPRGDFSSLEGAKVFSALLRASVPPSSPSHGGNVVVVGGRLLADRTSSVDRMLGSVPSPGVGH
ncbi:unnamed protein product [Spirodela intermedia]|uniref:Uncharacterized protein n=1 Tax=Spirodela intermedia TaxID=51605 RepID=A0A7I8KYH5_SPIIN|nr:unnamed protein product [Spirodela intermedia]